MSDNRIKPLSKEHVHKICAGQIIVSLASVSKELIENSLDAGANFIDIRLYEFGVDSIQIIDNGKGIPKSDLNWLGQHHCTSKISDFEDLQSVETFGFRGEALNALCAVSDVKILTRYKEDEIGSQVAFNNDGSIKSQIILPRQVGTTVTISNLFHCLPVRRKELITHQQREYRKLISVIESYCIGIIGVRISCSNQVNKKKMDVCRSIGHSLQSNLRDIFGFKEVEKYIELEQFDVETLSDDDGEKVIGENSIKISGFISNLESGRSHGDRQYFYVNHRPCDLPKLTKVINDTYRNYCRNKYPAVILKIEANHHDIDINVTPDKRILLIKDENLLLAIVKESLTRMFDKQDSIVPMNSSQVSVRKMFDESFDKRNLETDVNDEPAFKVVRCQSPCDQDFQNSFITATEKDTEKRQTTITDFFNSNNAVVEIPDKTIPISSKIAALEIEFEGEDFDLFYVKLQPKNTVECPGIKSDVAILYDLCGMKKELRKLKQEKCHALNLDRFCEARVDKDSNSAESVLQKELNKSDFEKMQIIGQFNKAYIITKDANELFIVDQHASDERKNYEKFMKFPAIEIQRLVHPVPLELSSTHEGLILSNIDLFKKQGFNFNIDSSKRVGKKLSLVTVPISKDHAFGRTDIDELISELSDSSPSVMNSYVLKRIKKMIASRACRASVMFGDDLSFSKMKSIVSNMGELVKPWICAHGRPTIRHLLNLDSLNCLS